MADSTRLLIERSWMLFVDGENFTRRGQEVLKAAGQPPLAGPYWQRDLFLWLPDVSATHAFISPHTYRLSRDPGPPPRVAPRATRSYFYGSMPFENEQEVTATRLALREIGFEPRVFPRRRGKSKQVDLALATDVLTLAGEGQYEVAVIFAGDGDYVPVVEAVKRLGRHVVVGFFPGEGDGLSPALQIAADEFVDLSATIAYYWKVERERLDREAAKAAQATSEVAQADEPPR